LTPSKKERLDFQALFCSLRLFLPAVAFDLGFLSGADVFDVFEIEAVVTGLAVVDRVRASLVVVLGVVPASLGLVQGADEHVDGLTGRADGVRGRAQGEVHFAAEAAIDVGVFVAGVIGVIAIGVGGATAFVKLQALVYGINRIAIHGVGD